MMLSLLCATLSFAAATDAAPQNPIPVHATALLQAWELLDRQVQAEPGEYAVWAWVQAEMSATVTVDGENLTTDKAPKRAKDREPANYWVKAGVVTLDGKPVSITLTDASAVALGKDGFEPEKVMEDAMVCNGGESVSDRRLNQSRHTNTIFVMPKYETREQWEAKADSIRRRMLLSSGLVPMPEKTPLNPVVFDKIDHGDYTVEKVHFEVVPGFLCTGNLYRPKGAGPFPAIVNPHGHWKNGRLENTDLCSVPGRCITFARMGAVAFTYDMIGYQDSRQFVHRGGGELDKLWGVHPFALQLLTSIRAVDFVSGLEGVDPDRIGCTGASGGGTQTFALYTIDPRVKVAAPVNMISSTMQGGCVCENAPLIRYSNSNMEIGAMMAPRPLLMVAATGDWTRETPRVEYPAIRSIYALYGAENNVECAQFDYGHNYNQDSRTAVYRFMGKHLIDPKRDWSGFTEPEFTKDSDDQLRVFPGEGPMEEYKSRGEKEIIEEVKAINLKKWDAELPADAAGVSAFQEEHGKVLADVMGVSVPNSNALRCTRIDDAEPRDGYMVEHWVFGRIADGDAVPAILYRGKDATLQDAVIVVHGGGKQALLDLNTGKPGALVAALIAQGKAVLAIDAFLLGEHGLPDSGFVREKPRVGAFSFLDTFQPTDAANRVQDVLTAAAFLRGRRDLTGRIEVCGLGGGGVWGLLAAAVDPGIGGVAADMDAFPLDDDAAWAADNYIPCIRSVGDVRTAAAMIAPRPAALWNVNGADGIARYGASVTPGTADAAALAEALR
jgi:dienelactone hydrolase